MGLASAVLVAGSVAPMAAWPPWPPWPPWPLGLNFCPIPPWWR
ncbi:MULTISPECIES: hypothetical protein [Mycobacterium]|nr:MULTISPECIES: hypothetical protein [Mycobacterium]